MDTEIDRISDLPDEMLEHILSFLTTKEAVQKSMISKQWTNLWASLSRLNFDETDFVSGNTNECYAKFKKFGDMVLNHRESSCIHTVHMRFHDYSFCDLVRTWMGSCKKFNPRVLSIEVPVPFRYFLEFMFTCESVEDMSLKISRLKDWSHVPKTVNLPHIRKLSLDKTRVDEDSLTRLFSGCPLLEDLSLEMCLGDFSSIFRQKTITSLSLIDCCDCKQQSGCWELKLSNAVPKIVNLPCIRRLNLQTAYLDEESIRKLLIGCPLLEELSLENCYGEFSTLFKQKLRCLSLNNCCMGKSQDTASWKIERAVVRTNICGSTVKSTVFIECTFDPSRRISNSLRCPSDPYLSKFICNTPKEMALDFCNTSGLAIFFSGVESLEFCAPATKADLKKELRKIGAFCNLKNLSLRLADWCMDPYAFDIVAWFLNNSPNLEKLTLYNPKRHLELNKRVKHRRVVLRHEKVYYNSLSVEFSQCKKLKRVEIKFCKNLLSDRNFKEALLQNMKGLEYVKVVISEFDE